MAIKVLQDNGASTETCVTPKKKQKMKEKILQELQETVDINGAFEEDYVIRKKLGSGSFGNVYCGERNGDQKLVAIKVQKLEMCTLRTRNVAELVHMKQLQHRNIPKYYGSYLDGLTLAIIMEYVPGLNLSELDTRCRLRTSTIATVCRGILCALQYIHGCSIIHKDVKGKNVLLGTRGEIKMADFGLSCSIDDIRPGGGTTCYMAPEILAKTTDFSYGVDIWSLGMTVIEMHNREPPYKPIGEKAKIQKMIANYQHPQLRTPSRIPAIMFNFLQECLRKPEKRPSATELLHHKFIQEAHSDATLGQIVCIYLRKRRRSSQNMLH